MNTRAIAIAVAIVVVAGAVYYLWPTIAGNLAIAPITEEATTQEAGAADMSGTWRSNTDTKFTREIRADGVIIDRYEGEPTAGINGEWSVVDPAQETGLTVPIASLTGMTVIKVVWEGGVETTYFAVNSLAETSMTTTDLTGRGEVTIWSKL